MLFRSLPSHFPWCLQPLRDYLAVWKHQGKWDGNAPPPPLPPEVVQATSERYLAAYRLITGKDLEVA